MTDRLADVTLRTLAPRATVSGEGDSLENIIPANLPNGAQCWVQSQAAAYRYQRSSVLVPNGVNIVAPINGVGRWIQESPLDPDVVNVRSLSDLPAPVAGVISLAAGTCYQIHGMVDVGANTLRLAQGTVLHGSCHTRCSTA